MDGILAEPKTHGLSAVRLNYKQYLLILEVLFVKYDDMIKRTQDLVELNMNYMLYHNDNWKDDWNNKKWKLSDAKTTVKATVTTNQKFVFIGNGGDESVFNTSEYEQVNDLSDSVRDKTYSVSVTAAY